MEDRGWQKADWVTSNFCFSILLFYLGKIVEGVDKETIAERWHEGSRGIYPTEKITENISSRSERLEWLEKFSQVQGFPISMKKLRRRKFAIFLLLKINDMKIYIYKKCSTCRNALKFLEARKIDYEVVPIREQPPGERELKTMLKIYNGEIRKLFNTSGLDYKALQLKEKLPAMTETEAIGLLAKNGNLVKRPFVLTKDGGVVGFNEGAWQKLF